MEGVSSDGALFKAAQGSLLFHKQHYFPPYLHPEREKGAFIAAITSENGNYLFIKVLISGAAGITVYFDSDWADWARTQEACGEFYLRFVTHKQYAWQGTRETLV